MQKIVNDFAEALAWIDANAEPFKGFHAGVGPYGEPQLLKKCVTYLCDRYPSEYGTIRTKREPDVLIPGRWALEFKIVRPFGDNGVQAEHWSQNLLHPYAGNVSAIGDALKLMSFNGPERKGIVVFMYEHFPPQIDLNVLVNCFEAIARTVVKLPIGERCQAAVPQLRHPVHQQAIVYGWELRSI